MVKKKAGRKHREKEKPRSLNLGCNRRPLRGFINVDLEPFKGVDVVADLEKRWPWEDSSIDFINAVDIVEHLKDKIHLMNEAWRVLKPGGQFKVTVPHEAGHGGSQDPTHVTWWNENSFLYFSVYRNDEDEWVSHDWRKLYAPHSIKAAFEIQLGVTEPSPPRDEPGGNFGGVIYIVALLIKREDPGDCESPEYDRRCSDSHTEQSDE